MGGLGALAAGAGLAWTVDPRRREALAQRAGRALHEVEGFLESGARDLGHRAAGAAHEARARLTPGRPDDDVLAERVRARLGHLTFHAHAIRVSARDGAVELAGPVFRAEHAGVLAGVRAVRGVRRLLDRLEPHETADVRALEGAGPRRPPRGVILPFSSPGYRLAAGAAGAFLVARAIFRGGLLRIPAGLAGVSLLRRVLGDASEARRAALREAAALAGRGSRPSLLRGEGRAGQARSRPRRVPQVHEVKSPAELEPGIASARPDPLRRGRVDRRDLRGTPGRASDPGDDDRPEHGEEIVHVAPHDGFSAPPAGAGVREQDLGAVLPHEDEER
jgi:hypothetical protein